MESQLHYSHYNPEQILEHTEDLKLIADILQKCSLLVQQGTPILRVSRLDEVNAQKEDEEFEKTKKDTRKLAIYELPDVYFGQFTKQIIGRRQ